MTAARKLLRRPERQSTRRFLVEGPQAVREAVTAKVVDTLFVTDEAQSRHADIVAAAHAAGAHVQHVRPDALAALAETVTPQGVIAVARAIDVPLDEALARSPGLVVVLSGVRDPGNAGTVVRTADAAGADAIVLCDTPVDLYNGKCVRASAGSIFHLPVAIAADGTDVLGRLRTRGLRVLAAAGTGATDLAQLAEANQLSGPTAWVLGNEARGLDAAVAAAADDVVRVPIYGQAESLNLAACAAVCLYTSAMAQRRHAAAADGRDGQ